MRSFSSSTLLIVGVIAILASCAPATVSTRRNEKYDLSRIKRVTVFPFSSNDADLGTNLADALGTELLGMGYDLIERNQIEEILREQKFELTGVVTPEKAKKIGQLAEVDGIITGNVTPFLGSGFVWGGEGSIAGANVRLIDTESGQIAFSSSYKNGEINATFQRFNRSVSVIAKSIAASLSK